jgi:hypothetical protein
MSERHVSIIGASMAGLIAARVLSDHVVARVMKECLWPSASPRIRPEFGTESPTTD